MDFGTTRTLVAQVDRGNYPIVGFYDTQDDLHEFFPSVCARTSRDGLRYGFEAVDAAEHSAPLVRSFKRALAAADVNAHTTIDVNGVELSLIELVTGFLQALRRALTERSTISEQLAHDPIGKVMVAVPAHAHSAQRFYTLEAFQAAGFPVAGMVNEPSAAGFEYTHRQQRTITTKRSRIIVYDLGGGTFDASLVGVQAHDHDVIDSIGINRLGGDDFDLVLARCACDQAGVTLSSLTEAQRQNLLDQARQAKEQLSPQSRRMVFDIADQVIMLPVDNFFAAATPLVERTIDAMRPLVGDRDDDPMAELAGIYLVGGASSLPLVPRLLRERFGRRVHRSVHPAASTAIGLAIAADHDSGFTLSDRLSRGFGVFREWDGGRKVAFDPLIGRHQPLPHGRSAEIIRRYQAVHDIGRFRFAEYSGVDAAGQPTTDVAPLADITFPFAAELQDGRSLAGLDVHRLGHGPQVEERYEIDENGIVTVTLTDLDTGYAQAHSLGR